MTTRRDTLHGVAAGALALAAGPTWSQNDTSVITIYVGAASSMDFTARLIAGWLREALGRAVVVVSKLGAGQRLAVGEVQRAEPDGRTLLFATTSPFTIFPSIYNKLSYEAATDFTPVCGVSTFDVAISTGPMTGATTFGQLIDWQKARKTGDAVFGSAPGNGSLSHFVGLSVGLATGTHMTHVAYKDSGVGIMDLSAGRLPMLITGLSPQVEMHKAGKIRLLAVSGGTRSPLVPDVPTLKEVGVNVSLSSSAGIFGPAKMPLDMVKRLRTDIFAMLADPATKKKLIDQAMLPWGVTGEQLAASVVKERKYFEALVKATGFAKQDA